MTNDLIERQRPMTEKERHALRYGQRRDPGRHLVWIVTVLGVGWIVYNILKGEGL